MYYLIECGQNIVNALFHTKKQKVIEVMKLQANQVMMNWGDLWGDECCAYSWGYGPYAPQTTSKEEKQVVSSVVWEFHSVTGQSKFRSPPPVNDTFKLAVVRVFFKYTARFTQILLPTSPLSGLAEENRMPGTLSSLQAKPDP